MTFLCLAMLTIGTRVCYVRPTPTGFFSIHNGTVVEVPSHASGNYMVLDDNVSAPHPHYEVQRKDIKVIPRRSLRLQLQVFEQI